MENIIYVIEPGDTMAKIAQKFNTDMNIIARYNGIPDLDHIEAGRILRIPQNFEENVYIIRPGDTLTKIARQYCTTVQELVQLNELSDPDVITAGESLKLPNEGCDNIHIVKEGDTLYALAKLYDTTPEALADLNGIEDPDRLVIGQLLRIPGENYMSDMQEYTVRSGDRLWKIAQKFNVTVSDLINWNRMCNPDYLVPGQKIRIACS